MLSDTTVDAPLTAVIALICAILFCISRPQYSKEMNTMPQVVSTPDEVVSISDNSLDDISSFLVLDVEATCVPSTGFDWPNEIIEWPVVLLRWDKTDTNDTKRLVVVDEFQSFVRPTFRPKLHPFCTELTGITQAQVDSAPTFPEVLSLCQQFLQRNGILNSEGRPLERFVWCTDGPWDLRDFFTKQVFISKVNRPSWIPLNILDVRQAFGSWYKGVYLRKHNKYPHRNGAFSMNPSYKLKKQLELLGLEFVGREHSGIDDSRNIARILIALAARGAILRPNLDISTNRRFSWMGANGKIVGDY